MVHKLYNCDKYQCRVAYSDYCSLSDICTPQLIEYSKVHAWKGALFVVPLQLLTNGKWFPYELFLANPAIPCSVSDGFTFSVIHHISERVGKASGKLFMKGYRP